MKVTQTDNRRLRKARWRSLQYRGYSIHPNPSGLRVGHNIAQITYLLDNQSARIARRLTWKEFAGVPASENSPAYIPDRSRYYWESKTAVNSNEYRCAVQLGGEWWKNIIRHGYVPNPKAHGPAFIALPALLK